MIKTLAVEEALGQDLVWVDVRTPAEYTKGSIPYAINIPLFTNKEHQLIGTTYHRNQGEARIYGFQVASSKLPFFYEKIRDLQDRRVIFYCFRGGMRSRSLATVMDLMGLEIYQLKGGYKAFRAHIMKNLPKAISSMGDLVVIYGLTGAGKTDLIRISKNLGFPAIDLEELAHHRGSAFGRMGIDKPQSQRDFEALLYLEIQKYKDSPYLLIEAESRNIGQVILPEELEEKMQDGHRVLLQCPLDKRIDRIIGEYAGMGEDFLPQAKLSLHKLQKRLGLKRVQQLEDLLMEGDLQEVVGYLLENYYDPLYGKSIENKDFIKVIREDSLVDAAKSLIQLLNSLSQRR